MGIKEDLEEKGSVWRVAPDIKKDAEEAGSARKVEQTRKDAKVVDKPSLEVNNYAGWLFGPWGNLGRAWGRIAGRKGE